MNARLTDQRLPLPNPEEWTDPVGAAAILNVDRTTVHRWISTGVLRAYPLGIKARGLWRAEVDQLAEARRIIRGK